MAGGEAKGSQQGGLVAGLLSGSFLGLVAALMATRPAAGATPEEKENWQYLFKLLEPIALGVAQLVDIANKFSLGEVAVNVKAGMVFMPLDPEGLNGAIQSMRLKGRTMFPTSKLSWACPFGVTTNFTLTLPANYVDTRRFCRITSDFYDPLITLNVFVDGSLATPQGIILTGATTIDYGEFYVKTVDVRFSVNNASAVNAVVTLEQVAALMEKSFYDEFYAPLISYMYKQLKEVASSESL